MSFALIDANSFYVSCEMVFRPDLQGKPIVVLSNNDGCIIARNAEAKALGIGMAEPYFKIRNQLRQHGVVVFSSNYALYADLSNRMMHIMRELAPQVEVYSIDECFADTRGIGDLCVVGREWRAIINQCTGLTCGIGFAPTKTLAKLANHAAKKWPATGGVVDLSNPARQKRLMHLLPVDEVWGVGRKLSIQLGEYKIRTVADLANADPKWIRKRFSVLLEKTVCELNGKSCLAIEEMAAAKQQVIASRSFGRPVTAIEDLSEAVAEYTARAAEKLRHEDRLCSMIHVYGQSYGQPYRNVGRSVILAEPTCDTRDLVKAALSQIGTIFQEGTAYKKAGVMLSELVSPHNLQQSLFRRSDIRNDRCLMSVIDYLNQAKRHSVRLAAQGIEQRWGMTRDHLSPAYTTKWSDIPTVK
ncbi:translesion error-prone DNA polymerase V subunit UmuC [Cardiobacteriaceae bacterium TAE3-ERU3]|nr:translesion error-prone DNA polymerase V subunit UmuC [Cardiobacteriaceae bacterium TAE3-ERU3]